MVLHCVSLFVVVLLELEGRIFRFHLSDACFLENKTFLVVTDTGSLVGAEVRLVQMTH